MVSSPKPIRKRGRPRKYTSTQEKKQQYAQQRQNQRQSVLAAERTAQFDQFYSAAPAASAELVGPQPDRPTNLDPPSIPPSTHAVPPREVTIARELEQLLPPISPPPPPPPDLTEEIAPSTDEPLLPLQLPKPIMVIEINQSNQSTLFNSPARASNPTSPNDAQSDHQPTREPDLGVCRLAGCLADQLYQHQGCCHECHESRQTEYNNQPHTQTGLADYLESMTARGWFPNDDLAHQVTPKQKQRVYCGVDPATANHSLLGVTLDIDSVLGFARSLAVAKRGVRWYPTQMSVSDLQSGLHLDPIPVHYVDPDGRAHTIHRPIHQVPHYTFGRLIGFEDLSIYLLRLRDQDFQHSLVQHYPSSFDHSRLNATALAREQLLFYFLPAEALSLVWQSVLKTVRRPGFHQFQDIRILADTWENMIQHFQQYWDNAIDEIYLTECFYYDIGKETCPTSLSQTILWRRCCLETYRR
ncbi:hypothetical protein BDV29DRAFT_201086 [Aspergillus leporis]|uniref:Uncharacterized protein n=1 Tax=Aspergillus leporis TaxID=41062 RepID=A0A5N5WHP6_9EURO|nr:hypothetical protein BDV29DRAFT_201086 [Aspergillus leporis]